MKRTLVPALTLIALAVSGAPARIQMPPTCTTPKAMTAAKVGAEKSVYRRHRGVSSTPAVSWPKKQEEMASAPSPVFIMNTPA